jgi:NADH-quinone oxidoreductase subunit E
LRAKKKKMLSQQEIREIEAHKAHYPRKQAACIEGLKVIQHHHGWVSDDHLKELAGLLDMSPEELDSVATFYNLIFRQPVGRHVILICDSISCWLMGYETIAGHLKQRLGIDFGQTTDDGRFTLLTIPCLGTCDHAPALMIDEDLHRDLTPESIDNLLKKYE